MKKGKLISKTLGIALVFVMIGAMLGGLLSTAGATGKFNIGDTVEVTANLNVRTGPGTSYPEITDPDYLGYAPKGTIGKILGGPSSADGYIWWSVDFGPGLYSGWSVEDGLKKVESPPGAFTLSGEALCDGTSPYNHLSWTSSSGATSYDVYRNGSFYYDLATLGTTFDNTEVTAGTTYTYFIRATNAAGSTDCNTITLITRSDCGSTRVKGIDVGDDIDWSQVYSAGYRFAFVKATEGIDWAKTGFEKRVEDARNAGLLVGVYHFARPVPNKDKAKEEAESFVRLAGSYLTEGYLRPALDVEDSDYYGEYPETLGKESLAQWIKTWMDTVEARTGVKPILYMNPYLFQFLSDSSIANQYDIWVVDFRDTEPTAGDSPDTKGWNTWAFWQYKWNVNLAGGVADLDLFNGDMSKLHTFVIIEGDHIPPAVDAFDVAPHSVTLGDAFTISYTVSDTGDSGLSWVQLWRKYETGSWEQVDSDTLSGVGNGPYSGSFPDTPSSVGTYWYGIHVGDNAGNWVTEGDSGLSPIEVEVTPADYDEYFWSVTPSTYDSDSDGFDDSVTLEMDVDTTGDYIDVTVVGQLYDPNTTSVDLGSTTWNIYDAAYEYGYLNLTNYGSIAGDCTYYLHLYDENGNYEEGWAGSVYLYPLGYVPPQPTWTFMVYLDGDNDLEEQYIVNFNLMELAADNPNVNIIVQFDRIPGGDSTNGDWTTTRRYEVKYDTDIDNFASYTEGVDYWDLGELNMAASSTLSDFVSWAKTNYPADHYCLIPCNHGGGWEPTYSGQRVPTGILWDDTSGGDYMSTAELGSALSSATSGGTEKLDLLFLDACLEQMIEVGYEIKDYSQYLVASQYIGWAPGPYHAYIASIVSTTTAPQLATAIVNEYHNELAGSMYAHTMSAVDLSQYGLASAISDFAQALTAGLPTYQPDIESSRSACQKFYLDSYIDLYHLAYLIDQNIADATIQSAAQAVMNGVNSAVIAEAHESGSGGEYYQLDDAHGISIYFPASEGDSGYSNYSGDNLAFVADKSWDEFLTAFFNPPGEVNISLQPSTEDVGVGEIFELVIQAEAGDQPVSGIDAFINFDPTYLEVLSVTPGASLPTVLENTYDNTAGTIDYSAGKLGEPFPTGTFTVATIQFEALAPTSPSTALTFSTSVPRETRADYAGNDVTGALTGGTVSISPGATVDISVVLQGGSRPPEAWAVPITIKFFNPGDNIGVDPPIYEFHLTTTKSDGTATCQCVGVMPGTYDITAQASNCPECNEGNCTLTNIKRSVVISVPSTAVDMGTLLAGDANCDGIINISDFGILAVSYMCTEGEPCYDCRADFDCNGIINISDFGLLAVNYMKMSPIEVSV